MNEYPLIDDHGLIGDLQTAALVSTEGTIDWFCSPRFDSPSIFGALLDGANGGHWTIAPQAPTYATKQLYYPDTCVLLTRFMTEQGVGSVVDFMPPASPRNPTSNHRLVRMLRCTRGEISFDIEIAPRFDYAQQPYEVTAHMGGWHFASRDTDVTVHVVDTPDVECVSDRRIRSDGVCMTVRLRAGMTRGLVLETFADGPPRIVSPQDCEQLLEDTIAFWHNWLARSRYTGRWRETVNRSAMTLKLMTYAPSGAMVAAPTTSLPEQVGGERNWDYRYAWVRDASLSLHALLGLGFTEEAVAFTEWLGDRVQEYNGPGEHPLKVMYRVDGSSDLAEQTLGHWEGYRHSAPVRVGNGAADQLQLDIYGSALECLHFADQQGLPTTCRIWQTLINTVDWVCENWDRPEAGIWETRGGDKDFTYGRLMSWTALDRAIRMATRSGRPAEVQRWTKERDATYWQILRRGWSPERAAFTQYLGSDVLDSALLRMPAVGFIPPQDPRWLSTLDAIRNDLVSDGLVYRYDPSASPDGLLGFEGTFSACTFWYVEALARAGHLREGRLVFEKMLTYANHLGLYSEEIGLTGEQLGNFPQALTHLALVTAALSLDAHLDAARPGFPPTSAVPVPFLYAQPMAAAAGGPPVTPTTPYPSDHVIRR
ncbi:glycoside hydrolase family 15 protein [Streptomyces sp. NPDC052301]|uniref:glycoside hydrolase family 15 protein n=1 Tax=Streptomyces sp. NPDC052301 TaxID=3365687 RepID=UPI0037D72F48